MLIFYEEKILKFSNAMQEKSHRIKSSNLGLYIIRNKVSNLIQKLKNVCLFLSSSKSNEVSQKALKKNCDIFAKLFVYTNLILCKWI